MPLVTADTGQELPSLPYDREAASVFLLDMPPAGKVELQFPPKILSDGKSSNWQEDHRYGYEEFALWRGSFARKVSIEIIYLVWASWTVEKIEEEVLKIKEHLYVSRPGVLDKVPFFSLEGYRVVDATKKTPKFRLMDVSIENSREYVGKGVNHWPLKTTINLSCKLITREGSFPRKSRLREPMYNGRDLPAQMNKLWF